MPLNTPPIGYTGEVLTGSNQAQTKEGIVRAATAAEAAAGTRTDVFLSPATGSGSVPAASEIVAGKAEIATQAETNTGTSDTTIVTPLKLKTNLTTPPAIGGTTPAAGTFTTLAATTGTFTTANATTFDTNVAAAGVTLAGITLAADGTDANIDINVAPKGTGDLKVATGDVQATNGNIVMGTAGNGIQIKEGANATMGDDVLTAGTVTVNTTACSATSQVFISRLSKGASTAVGTLEAVPGASSFVVTSLNPTDATTQTNDISTFSWVIMNPVP
jgi:hypothetical protein